MTVKTNTLSKSDLGFAMQVDVSYVCPYCKNNVSDTLNFSKDGLGRSVVMCDCECPNCGRYIDLDVDL